MIDNSKIYTSQDPIINYYDILIVFKFRENEVCRHIMSDHTMIYVYSGEMIVRDGKTVKHLFKGDCAFLGRNYKLEMTARSFEGMEFKGAFLVLSRPFLMHYYHEMDKKLLPERAEKRMVNIVKLKEDLHVSSLFQALSTFFVAWEEPSRQYMELKRLEAIDLLIMQDHRFCINLFDFIGAWKISISDFMNESYKNNFSVTEMALFTGRSLAAFKRDFKQISELTPQRWVTHRRLEEAYRLITEEHKTTQSFYLELGFKSLSHFSTAFKRQYGITPSELLNKHM